MILLIILLILLGYVFFQIRNNAILVKNLALIILIIAILLLALRFAHPILAFLSSMSILLLASLNKIINLLSHTEAVKKIWHSFLDKKSAKNEVDNEITEAAKILGLKINASEEEINKAFRKLIKKHHPDHGGEASFVDKLTKAREILLKNNLNKR